MKKKILFGAAATALIAPLAACGTAANDAAEPAETVEVVVTETDDVDVTVEAEPAATPVADGERVPVVWFAQEFGAELAAALDGPEFQAACPHVEIVAQPFDGTPEAYATAFQTRVAGGNTPDIFTISTQNRSDVINNGLALDLAGQPFLDRIDPAFSAIDADGDRIFSLATGAWFGGVIYNRDLFAQTSFDEFPTTWEDFIALGVEAQDLGVAAYMEPLNHESSILAALLASDAEQRYGDATAITWDGKPEDMTYTEAWLPVLDMWQEAIDAGVVPQVNVAMDVDQVAASFANGEIMARRDGTWSIHSLRELPFEWGVAPFPAVPGGESFLNGGTSGRHAISASASPEVQEAALCIFDFMTSAEGAPLVSEVTGAVSVTHEYLSDPGEEFREVYEDYVQNGRINWFQWSQNAAGMADTMINSQHQQILGQFTPEQFAEAMQTEYNRTR